MNIEFAWVWLLLCLPLPLLVAWLAPRAESQEQATLQLPFADALRVTTTSSPASPSRIRIFLATLAWVLLVIAAARPRFVGEPVQLPVSGRNLMLAVDISGSMQSQDMRIDGQNVTRLHAVKEIAGNFIQRRKGDRLGLILFADQAYLQTPLTFDRKTTRIQLNEAAIGLAGSRTAIGDAIGLAVKRLRDQPEKNRVLVLLTDGDNNAGEVTPRKAAELARRENVRIYTIGIGAEELLVQSFFGSQRIPNNELDETTLKAIAATTQGRYFRARDASELKNIYHMIDEIEPISQDKQTFRPVAELYQWPLGLAVFLSLLIAMLSTPVLQRHVIREVKHA